MFASIPCQCCIMGIGNPLAICFGSSLGAFCLGGWNKGTWWNLKRPCLQHWPNGFNLECASHLLPTMPWGKHMFFINNKGTLTIFYYWYKTMCLLLLLIKNMCLPHGIVDKTWWDAYSNLKPGKNRLINDIKCCIYSITNNTRHKKLL